MAKIYKRGNASLFDIPIESIQDRMAECLPWLDSIFGKCERLTRKDRESRLVNTPNWLVRGNEYISVLPDDRVLKNTAFFILDEPMEFIQDSGKYRVGFSVIVWGDMRTVTSERNLEYVKAQLIKAVRVANPALGHIEFQGIYEKSENVWRGFTVDEVDNQFMMQPFFSLRLYGRLYMNEVCR